MARKIETKQIILEKGEPEPEDYKEFEEGKVNEMEVYMQIGY